MGIIRQNVKVIRKLKNRTIDFKNCDGEYKLKEFELHENSGYALFTAVRHDGKDVYFTAIAPKREEVLYLLVDDILKKMFWTSRVNLSWPK